MTVPSFQSFIVVRIILCFGQFGYQPGTCPTRNLKGGFLKECAQADNREARKSQGTATDIATVSRSSAVRRKWPGQCQDGEWRLMATNGRFLCLTFPLFIGGCV